MELFVIRHAIALDALPGQSDDARPLSQLGIERFKQAARGLDGLKVRLDRIYHSPKLRAVQTANLLVGLLQGQSVVTAHLAQVPTKALLDELEGSRVAVVGHEPWVSELCGWLIMGERSGANFTFKKGGVAHLEGRLEPGQMRLLAFYPPKVWR